MVKGESVGPISSGKRIKEWIYARVVTLTYVYVTCLYIWATLRFFFQDRWSWLFLVSGLSACLFLFLPLTLIIALLVRRRGVWLSVGLAMALWLAVYGALFLPKLSRMRTIEPALTAMTYNVFGFNRDPAAVVNTIRTSGADVVSLVELSPEIASAVERELRSLYPYQVLDPRPDVFGMGIISRYPLQSNGDALPGDRWMGDPQILTMDFDGREIILVHFHAIPMATTGGMSGMLWSVNKREEQAQSIVAYVSDNGTPAVVLGDLNASDQHEAHRILARSLSDAWREAGWGWGHTYSHMSPYKSLKPLTIGDVSLPIWVVRIDYIFHTKQWRTESAWLGSWDGASDHRPVMAKLVLADEN